MLRSVLFCAIALLIATPAFSADDDAAKDAAKEAKKKEKEAKKKAEKETKDAKSADAPKPSADAATGSPDDLNARLNDTVARMEQMDKDWKNKRAPSEDSSKSSEKVKIKKSDNDDKSADDEKEAKKKEPKEKKVSSKDSKHRYSDADYAAAMAAESNSGHRARVYYDGHVVEEGAWTEIGGVTSSSHTSGSEGPFRSYSEGSGSSTSIGVRATVIRLDDGPDE